jgi:hypothetical protein
MYGNPRFTTQSMSSELFFTGSAGARNIAASGAGIHGSLGRSLSCCTNGHQGRDRCCARCVTSAVVMSLRNHRRSGRVCREVVASWGNEIISFFRLGLLINIIPLATVQDFRCTRSDGTNKDTRGPRVLTSARTPVYEMHISSDYISNFVYEDLEPACTSSCLIVVCTKNPTVLSTRTRLSSLPVNCRDRERRVALCSFDNLPAFSL